MTIVCAALLGSLLFPAPARVGVVAVGDDAGTAGELQRALELRLSGSRKLEVVDLSSALPAGPARPATGRAVDPALQKEADAILQEATDAYYQDRAALALDRLAALAALQDRTQAFPVSERVRLLLWRTAVFLALKDDTQAEAEALAALNLNPDLKVDLNEFRPSVKDAVDRVRARGGVRTVTVIVSGLPPGATLELDDRPVTAPFRASVGKHRLAARAAGRRDVVRTFEATADIAVPMSLPLSTDAATEAKLLTIALATEPSREQRDLARELASKLKLDWVIVAAATGPQEARAMALGRSAYHAAPAGTAPNVAAWIEGRLVSEPVAAATTPAPTPRPAKTPRPEGGAPKSYAVTAAGGLAWTSRSRSLEGKGGGGFETSFGGVGPRITADVTFGAPFAHVEAAWVNYGISSLDVTLPDGSSETVNGGTTTIARLHGGWRQPFGSGGEPDARMSAYAALGVSVESHAAKDVSDPAQGKLGLLTGYQRTAVEIALGGRAPLGGSMRPAISAGLVIAPVSTWTETPANKSGTDPAPALGLGWSLGVAMTPASRLTLALEYSGSMRSVAFEGEADAPVDPALTDATIQESFHSIGMSAGYRF